MIYDYGFRIDWIHFWGFFKRSPEPKEFIGDQLIEIGVSNV